MEQDKTRLSSIKNKKGNSDIYIWGVVASCEALSLVRWGKTTETKSLLRRGWKYKNFIIPPTASQKQRARRVHLSFFVSIFSDYLISLARARFSYQIFAWEIRARGREFFLLFFFCSQSSFASFAHPSLLLLFAQSLYTPRARADLD